ncbi:hypothetical protein PG993_001872 [Apiospora rasikravindrae]|uniref:Uncharacterized protein n=1 Tax=Apiospora rasikravindrae TaxID=990691 RepID=A0ABR1UF04_9PEZI
MRPGGEATIQMALAGNYQRCLVHGEQHVMLWPGAEIAMWAPGSLADQTRESQHTRRAKLPQLVLPAPHEGVRLYRFRHGSGVEDKWEWCGPDDGFGTVEGEPHSDRFVNLRPVVSRTP